MVYRFDKDNNRLVELEETTFPSESLSETVHIEEWVRKNPKLLCDRDEQIKVISKQQIYETRKRSDLVALDNLGQIVIIELKRDIAEPMSEFQAIRYASSYLDLAYDEICSIYAKYLEQNRNEFNINETEDFLTLAQKEIDDLCSGISISEKFNKNQRIILCAKDFSDDLKSAVQWLILKGIDIKCIALTPYKDDFGLLVVPEVILPTHEISENIVRVKQDEEKVEQEKQRTTYRSWEGNMDDQYNRLQPPLGDYLKRLVSVLGIQPTNESGAGFHLVNGNHKIMVATWVKSKIEFRFPKTTKSDLENLLKNLHINSLIVKEKSGGESYGLANPTPAIDYKEGSAPFEDIITLAKNWLQLDK